MKTAPSPFLSPNGFLALYKLLKALSLLLFLTEKILQLGAELFWDWGYSIRDIYILHCDLRIGEKRTHLMDPFEAIKAVMPRIQNLDPDNASRILCSILMREGGEKELIRLAFVSDSVLVDYMKQVKYSLGLSSDGSSSCSKPSSSPFPQSSPTIMIPKNEFHSSNPLKPISYADAVNGSRCNASPSSSLPPLYVGEDRLPFLDEAPMVSPSGRSDSLVIPSSFHRRSLSVNDVEEPTGLGLGLGSKPCVYYARGFCKNGSSCKFIHSDIGCGDSIDMLGSPTMSDSGFDELLRIRALQQHQHKLSLMASGGHHPFHYNKYDFSPMALRPVESSSLHQIYLTFPAESTFDDDDVYRYFSKFGPVQDVRIPYQQKRMFGFVTFYHPESVKLILAKGNPHFVCDSRVLVKPYKEKGKVADKKQQHQHLDRGENPACLNPSRIDPSEIVDLPIGPRMLLNTQEMIRRKKLEQMELQHAIKLQGQRFMNFQIMDRENQQLDKRFLPNMLGSVPVSSHLQSQFFTSRKTSYGGDVLLEFNDDKFFLEGIESSTDNKTVDAINHGKLCNPDLYFPESNFENALPDNLFASPTKSSPEHNAILTHTSPDRQPNDNQHIF